MGPDVPVRPISSAKDQADSREALLVSFRDRFFAKTDENAVFEIFRRSGKRMPIYRSDLASGAILESITLRAKERALLREIENGDGGVSLDDLLWAAQCEYDEGDILPPAEIALEWMSLLDIETQDVVDVRKIRPVTGSTRTLRAIE